MCCIPGHFIEDRCLLVNQNNNGYIPCETNLVGNWFSLELPALPSFQNNEVELWSGINILEAVIANTSYS